AQRAFQRGAAHAQIELGGATALDEQPLFRPFEGEALVVKQGLDAQDQIEIAPPVQSLAGRVLLGAEETELRLPVAQDIGGPLREALDLADPVVELVRDRHVALPFPALRRAAAAHVVDLTSSAG